MFMFKLLGVRPHGGGFHWYDPIVQAPVLPRFHGGDVTKWPKLTEAQPGRFVWEKRYGIYRFAYESPNRRSGGNYEGLWSSRASCLGVALGTPMIDVMAVEGTYYRLTSDVHIHHGYAVTVSDLRLWLGEYPWLSAEVGPEWQVNLVPNRQVYYVYIDQLNSEAGFVYSEWPAAFATRTQGPFWTEDQARARIAQLEGI